MKLNRVDSTANRLRIAMDLAGKRQIDIVNELNIDKGAMSNYVHGKYEPKQDILVLLARALNVSDMWLWGYDVPMERPRDQAFNDDMSKVVNRMKDDSVFYDSVIMLFEMTTERLQNLIKFLQ